MRIHHVAFEARKVYEAEETRFWNIIGFAELRYPTRGSDRRTRWLVGEGAAIELRLRTGTEPPVDLGHIAIITGPFHQRIINQLERFGHGPVEEAEQFFGWRRAYATSPTGHHVELMEGAPSHKAGVPLEEGATT